MRVGDAVLADPVFYVIDLGDLPKVEGVDCDGLVGYEMFRRFGVTIDYEKRALVLADPAKFAPPAGASVVPFELDDRIPIVQGTLDGVPARMSVDTGSRSSLTMHSPFVREHKLVEKYHASPEAVIGWGVGGPSRGQPARFGTLVLGDLKMPVSRAISTPATRARSPIRISPEISAAACCKRFTVAFDYANKRLYFAPNAELRKARRVRSQRIVPASPISDALVVADVARDERRREGGFRDERSHRRNRRRAGRTGNRSSSGGRSSATCRSGRSSRSIVCATARKQRSSSCSQIASPGHWKSR